MVHLFLLTNVGLLTATMYCLISHSQHNILNQLLIYRHNLIIYRDNHLLNLRSFIHTINSMGYASFLQNGKNFYSVEIVIRLNSSYKHK